MKTLSVAALIFLGLIFFGPHTKKKEKASEGFRGKGKGEEKK